MKKRFLILCVSLTLISGALYAEEANTGEAGKSNIESSSGSGSQEIGSNAATSSSGKGASFMAAFGMDAGAGGDTGEAGPGSGSGSSSAGSMSAGLGSITSSAGNQVTPPFTPYSYRK